MIKKLYNLIRPYTPEKHIWASGFAYPAKMFDQTQEIEYKPVAIKLIKRNVSMADKVVDLGTGYGIFSLICRRQGATVHTIEASNELLRKAESLHRLMDYPDTTFVNGLVEADKETADIFGEMDNSVPNLSAKDLPHSNVMIIDIEGSELNVIQNLGHKPGTILVETHPDNESPTWLVDSKLVSIGYNTEVYKYEMSNNSMVVARYETE